MNHLCDEKRITRIELNGDGTADVTYECGHTATWIIPPKGITSVVCAECVDEFVELVTGERRTGVRRYLAGKLTSRHAVADDA